MKAQTEITRLQDAKALKEIGVPCNTPVAHHKFSLKFSRHWRSLVDAQVRFLNAVFKYAADGQNASVRRRRQVGSRLDDITKAIRRCDAFVVGGANRSDEDEHEKGILALFLIQRAVPFVEFWRETIEAIANGTSSEIEWRDIPVWFDEFMSKPGVEEILVEGEGGRPFCHDNRRTDTPQDVITKGSFLPRYSAVT